MGRAELYEIRLATDVGNDGAYWFDAMTVRQDSQGIIVVSGPTLDKAGLLKALTVVVDLNLKLISVTLVDQTS